MKSIVKLLPGIFWFALILFLLTLPGQSLPQVGWMDHLQVDKLVHISLFFVLVSFWSWGLSSTTTYSQMKKTTTIVAILALAYGIALEFVQKYWIPNRSFDGWDILADGIGSFLPVAFTKKLMPRSV